MAISFDFKDKIQQRKMLLADIIATGQSESFTALGLVDQIAERLKRDILCGIFKGGDQLLEDHLKQAFGVSRTPLREAFRVLEKQNLVEILPRKGTFVKEISREDIEKNFPVRACLEGLAARLAYRNLTKQAIEELEKLFGKMRDAAERDDFMAYSKHHASFHEVFIQAAENEILVNILNNLRMHTLWHRYTFQYYKEDFKNSLKVHRRILDLLKSRKTHPEEIERVVREHIEIALGPFLNAMERLEKENAK